MQKLAGFSAQLSADEVLGALQGIGHLPYVSPSLLDDLTQAAAAVVADRSRCKGPVYEVKVLKAFARLGHRPVYLWAELRKRRGTRYNNLPARLRISLFWAVAVLDRRETAVCGSQLWVHALYQQASQLYELPVRAGDGFELREEPLLHLNQVTPPPCAWASCCQPAALACRVQELCLGTLHACTRYVADAVGT